MGGVAVVTDSSAGIPSDLVDELGISVVPVDVLVDGVVLPHGGSLDLAQAVMGLHPHGPCERVSSPSP